MRFLLTALLCFPLLTCAVPAGAQPALKRDSAEYYFQRGASFYETPGANREIMASLRRRAIGNYTKSIAFDSSYYWAYRNRGYCYQNFGEYGLALADYEQAILISRRIGHESLDYLHSRCITMCMNLMRWAAAEVHCSAFLTMPGYDSMYYHSVWRNRAEVRVQLHKYVAARQDYVVYQRQTVAELLVEEKNLIEVREHAISERDLKRLPRGDRAKALAYYSENLAQQVATVDKLRAESAATTARIIELENLMR